VGIGVVTKVLGDGYYEIMVEGGHIRNAWCVDLTPCAVDQVVAVADIDNWHHDQNILPPVNQKHGYGRDPSNMWKGAEQLPPATCVMSYLKFDLWQRICPTFRIGAARSINYLRDEMDVELRDRTLHNVPVEYMTCNSVPFDEGDRVVVEFQYGTWDQAKVIGFESNPDPCDFAIIRDMTLKFETWEAMEHPGIFSTSYSTLGDLFKLDRKNRVTRITEGEYTRNHHISPLGDWLCFNKYNTDTSEWEIWKCKVDGTAIQKVPITLLSGYEELYGDRLMWPRWSGNGDYITFTAGYHDIWYVHPDGSDYGLGIILGPKVGIWYQSPGYSPSWNKQTYILHVNAEPPGPQYRKMVYQDEYVITKWCNGRDDFQCDCNPMQADRIVWGRFAVGTSIQYDGAIMEYAPGKPGADPTTGIRVLMAHDPDTWYEPGNEEWATGHWGWPSYNTRISKILFDDRTIAGPGGILVMNLESLQYNTLLDWGIQPCYWRFTNK